MKKLYIRGLVKVADTVRRELSQPLSPGRRAGLRCFVRDSMGQVDQILARHGAVVGSLPAPTRRAYQFLATRGLDIKTGQHGGGGGQPKVARETGKLGNWGIGDRCAAGRL